MRWWWWWEVGTIDSTLVLWLGLGWTRLGLGLDNLQETGCYAWSNDAYGCYNINDTNECSNIGPFFNLIINFCTVVCFYSVITFKMLRYRFKSNHSEVYNENMKSISMTMLILTIAYLAFLLPVLIFETCSPAGSFFPSKKKRMIIASW